MEPRLAEAEKGLRKLYFADAAQSVSRIPMVYVICHFQESGVLKGGVLHAVDSTELFNDNWRPLFSTEIDDQKIRVYEDFDCDCGVSLIKPPAAKTGLSDNTDSETLEVTLDDMRESAIIRLGQTDEGHEHKCGAAPGECFRSGICPQYFDMASWS